MTEKITVIVPAYNVEDYIKRCLDSILNSTYQNLEIIAIDDGSSDRTGAILDTYKSDPRVIVIHQNNIGLVLVREKGISMATGDYVGFVDGDDAVDPDMYERLLKNAIETDADISHCGLCVYWDEYSTEMHYGSGKKLVQTSDEALWDLLQAEIFDASLCNKLYRRSIMANSCLDTGIQSGEDLLRNFVLFSRAKCIVYEDFCGYQYWSRSGSMSNGTQIVHRAKQMERVRAIILNNANRQVYPAAKRLWLSTFVGTFNQNYRSSELEVRLLCNECRIILRKERKNIRYLVKRQQIAAYLIIYAPWLHRVIYRIYDSRRK